MPKAKLKKHLLSLTKEQITDIVLELYDARKEAKDYPEFYLAQIAMQNWKRARKLSETSSSQLVDFPKSRHLPNVEKSFPIFKSLNRSRPLLPI